MKKNTGNRSARAALSPVLMRRSPTGDPRARSNAQQGTSDADMTGPLTLDRTTGKQTVAFTGALTVNRRGQLDINVASPLVATPGSPISIKINADDSLPVDQFGRMTAQPRASSVRNDSGATGRTLADVINAVIMPGGTMIAIESLPVGTTAGTVAAGNDARIVALGAKVPLSVGIAVLVAGTVVVPHTLVSATSVFIVTHQVFGGVVGIINVPARVVGVSFTITSANALDTSTVAYSFYEPF